MKSTLQKPAEQMSFTWQPDPDLVSQISAMIGLIDSSYSNEDVGEFVSYWVGRPERFHTPYQWNQKFVLTLKRLRTAHWSKNSVQVGSQFTQNKPGLTMSDSARALVEKYGKK